MSSIYGGIQAADADNPEVGDVEGSAGQGPAGKISGALKGAVASANSPKKTTSSGKTPIQYNKEVDVPSYKTGGKVKRTGMARVHRGERVLNAKQARKYDRKRGRK